MSQGYGRELLTIACLVACSTVLSARVVAQAPQQQPSVAPQAPAAPGSAAPQAPAGPGSAGPQAPSAPGAAAPAAQGPAAFTAPATPAQTPQAAPAAGPAAELPKGPPSLEATERARTAYARGQQAFAANDFAVALDAFQEAYANVSNPIVLLSIAESAAKLGRIDVALGAYDAYLRTRPDAPDRDEVAQKRAALAQSQLPAQLVLTSEPAGADVILDGQLVGRTTPVTLEVRPGVHRIALVLTGFETERLELELAPSGHVERSAVLRAAPNAVLAQPAPPPTKPLEAPPLLAPEPPRAAIIVTASLGAAGVIAGTVLGIFALKERSDYNTMPTEASADRGERLALFSDVGFGIGAMSLITTAVLLFTHDPPRADERSDSARFEIMPSFTARSASASAKVRF